jgi:hypothetical protein
MWAIPDCILILGLIGDDVIATQYSKIQTKERETEGACRVQPPQVGIAKIKELVRRRRKVYIISSMLKLTKF